MGKGTIFLKALIILREQIRLLAQIYSKNELKMEIKRREVMLLEERKFRRREKRDEMLTSSFLSVQFWHYTNF